MENERIKAWLPAIRAGSGTDVYTRRLAASLERHGIMAQITWFPLSHELLPALLQRTQPPLGTDIIIANSWNGFAFERNNLPLVVIVHHCVFDPGLRPYKSVLQSLYHRFFAEPREVRSMHAADAVVTVSHYVANHLRQKISMDGVEVINNWVDTELFKPKPQETHENRPFRLLFIGKPTRLKGGDLLAPLMRRLGTDFELRFTAEPQDCRRMNLPANMIPVGKFTEQGMVRAYQECDAVLLPSHAEGFGYAALEGMACGKPVITSNNTALPEIIIDGVTGILCETNDIEAFARAGQLLAQDSTLCSVMGSAGRQRTMETFSESMLIDRYIRLIHQCLMPKKDSLTLPSSSFP
ncbi:glycosyl transferase family 1 [Sulfuricella sp. T08]|uniref:glycosyltransferase family 4 protein n=1 Tax=Sulfuricella sp. T08 TaxID=1632857 RepID=UPI0006179D45|nr:glycosyltransferase family 4 protein [Sulfuricella sp. T08]GAO37042.1 glycosyl transferase family 1 [Sulfuricella sp. T08]